MDMKSKFLFALVFGLISGGLTVYLPSLGLNNDLGPIMPVAGVLFGLAACLYFTVFQELQKWLNYVGWVILCVIAYNVAFWTTFFIVATTTQGSGRDLMGQPSGYFAFFVGGLVGGFLTLVTFRWLVVKISFKEVLLLSLCSAILGLSGVYPNANGNYPVLFMIWQSVMLLLIAIVSEKYFLNVENQNNLGASLTLEKRNL